MESFSAENEDEVGFKAGERIHVINKSMDGWWKIRYVCTATDSMAEDQTLSFKIIIGTIVVAVKFSLGLE